MTDIILYGGIVIIIAILLWLFVTKVLKNKKGTNTPIKVTIDIDCLIDALGGLENIEKMEATNSKASFMVVDVDSIDASAIKELGATGVVQSNQKVTAIFGRTSGAIIEAIEAKR